MNKNLIMVLVFLFPSLVTAFTNEAPTISDAYEIEIVTDHDGEAEVVNVLIGTIKDLSLEILIGALDEIEFSHKRLEHVPETTAALQLLEASMRSYQVLEAFVLHADLKATPALKKKYPSRLILLNEKALVALFRGYIARLKLRIEQIKASIKKTGEEEVDGDPPPEVQHAIKRAMTRNNLLADLEIPKREWHLFLKE